MDEDVSSILKDPIFTKSEEVVDLVEYDFWIIFILSFNPFHKNHSSNSCPSNRDFIVLFYRNWKWKKSKFFYWIIHFVYRLNISLN